MLFWWDPLYFLFAMPALLLGLYAQAKVQAAYNRWLQAPARLTGLEAAQRLLQTAGLYEMRIEGTPGHLTDHYDPSTKTLRLSPSVAGVPSVASLAVAAHEIGHALQDAEGHWGLRARAALVPAVNFGSWLGPILFLVGFLMQSPTLVWAGVLFFSAAALFALVTLPVELDASRRALALLEGTGLLRTPEERAGAREVLRAAALTYVAALAQALSTLAYYVFLALGLQRSEE
ncbi:MAG: zinc metallopeptidase [Thermoflexus sp.]|jgi:Zn-dependent membrane protease YugP|nr:zinc metallopeptidase [Thermoflexus sp.]